MPEGAQEGTVGFGAVCGVVEGMAVEGSIQCKWHAINLFVDTQKQQQQQQQQQQQYTPEMVGAAAQM
jgi:hypothetical protein